LSYEYFAMDVGVVVAGARATTTKRTSVVVVVVVDGVAHVIDRQSNARSTPAVSNGVGEGQVEDQKMVVTAYLEQVEHERRDEDSVQVNVLVLQDVLQRAVQPASQSPSISI